MGSLNVPTAQDFWKILHFNVKNAHASTAVIFNRWEISVKLVENFPFELYTKQLENFSQNKKISYKNVIFIQNLTYCPGYCLVMIFSKGFAVPLFETVSNP